MSHLHKLDTTKGVGTALSFLQCIPLFACTAYMPIHNQTSPYVKQMPLLKSSDSYVVSCVEHIKFIVVCGP